MPILRIDGKDHEVAKDKRLVLAIEETGIHIGHRCGGKARCTTCRVDFKNGEPGRMTRAERDKLAEKGLLGEVRLSCQLLCEHDMELVPLMTLENQEAWRDTGPEVSATIEPEPEWLPLEGERDAAD